MVGGLLQASSVIEALFEVEVVWHVKKNTAV